MKYVQLDVGPVAENSSQTSVVGSFQQIPTSSQSVDSSKLNLGKVDKGPERDNSGSKLLLQLLFHAQYSPNTVLFVLIFSIGIQQDIR